MTSTIQQWAHKPWLLALIVFGTLLLQIAALSQQVDAYSLVQRGFGGWQGLFGYLGAVAKWAVVLLVSLLLMLAPKRSFWSERIAAQFSLRRSVAWFAIQWLSFGALWVINIRVFGSDSSPSAFDFSAWTCTAGLVFFTSMMALMPQHLWRTFFVEHYHHIALSVLVASLMLILALSSGKLWGPLASGTFHLAEFWLGLMPFPDLYVDEAERTLGIHGFYVHVADACSGYEGIGLVSAFTALFFYLYRDALRFPAAWLLWPIGVLVIWLLNSVRIAALILIGALWSPDVAVGGFHSQAGWLMFISTSVALLWLALKFPFFIKQSDNESATSEQVATQKHDGFEVLVPIVALLGSTLVIGTFSAGFDYAYPLKVIAVAASLAWVWRHLKWQPAVPRRPLAYIAGIAVAIIWTLLLGMQSPSNSEFQSALDTLDPTLAYLWLLLRVIGASITVPIAEELAFRGYLMARLSKSESFTYGPMPRVWLALLVSSVAFGALHGAWVAGAVAGAIYGYVRWHSPTINEAIWAHAMTNGLLCVVAVVTGAWHLL